MLEKKTKKTCIFITKIQFRLKDFQYFFMPLVMIQKENLINAKIFQPLKILSYILENVNF